MPTTKEVETISENTDNPNTQRQNAIRKKLRLDRLGHLPNATLKKLWDTFDATDSGPAETKGKIHSILVGRGILQRRE